MEKGISQAEYRKKMTPNVLATTPCYKESQISMKCLDKNNYDREKCENEFENYKQCKQFWAAVQKDRKDKGLPLPDKMTEEERNKIKEDYMSNVNKKLEIIVQLREEREEKLKQFKKNREKPKE